MRGTKEYYKDREKKWRWRAKASNGRITGDSGEGYERLSDAKRGAWVTAITLLFGKTKYVKE